MVPFILSPREHHGVRSVEEYLQKHAQFMKRQQRMGARYQVHESPGGRLARIHNNQWLIDCECGAGNSVHPEWGIACCFGCGAIHRLIIVPAEWREITAELVKRENPYDRHWMPGETVDDLKQENREREDEKKEKRA